MAVASPAPEQKGGRLRRPAASLLIFVLLSLLIHGGLVVTMKPGQPSDGEGPGQGPFEVGLIELPAAGEPEAPPEKAMRARPKPATAPKAVPNPEPRPPPKTAAAPAKPKVITREAEPGESGVVVAESTSESESNASLAVVPPEPQAEPREKVVARVETEGLEVARYADGSRTVRGDSPFAAWGRDGRARRGLGELASAALGGGNGQQRCNPYGRANPGGSRNLVLMVDTSGSITNSGDVPAVMVCAAGAALSALARGHTVSVINFSSGVYYLRPTRNRTRIYEHITTQQLGGTRLPPASLLRNEGTIPNDFVLITDAQVENLTERVAEYGAAINANPANRGLLYVLRNERLEAVAALRDVGFATRFVEKTPNGG